jgi:hypothetical protein
MTSCADQCRFAGSHRKNARARITASAHQEMLATIRNNRRPYHRTGSIRQLHYVLKYVQTAANSRQQLAANSRQQIAANNRQQLAANSRQQIMPRSRRQTAANSRRGSALQSWQAVLSATGARSRHKPLLRNPPPIGSQTIGKGEHHSARFSEHHSARFSEHHSRPPRVRVKNWRERVRVKSWRERVRVKNWRPRVGITNQRAPVGITNPGAPVGITQGPHQ